MVKILASKRFIYRVVFTALLHLLHQHLKKNNVRLFFMKNLIFFSHSMQSRSKLVDLNSLQIPPKLCIRSTYFILRNIEREKKVQILI